MAEETTPTRHTLGVEAARQLGVVTKTVPMMEQITPRWLISFLPWVPVEAGRYRVNKVKPTAPGTRTVECGPGEEVLLPEIYVDYEENPREYTLSAVTTTLDVHTRISDLYRSPHDQIREQLRLIIEKIKERQERELVNNKGYGLLSSVAADMRIKTRKGAPTPDDLDELIARIWKEPAFFLAHPRAIAAFGRECTRRGVPPPIVTLFGSPFMTWRGLPLVPCDKLPVEAEKTSILLLRTGEQKQGVVGLFQPGLAGEVSPSLTVRFMGIDHKAIASYLISLYCSIAVLTEDALGVLEDVDVSQYHEYK
jgi:hypothetical protein